MTTGNQQAARPTPHPAELPAGWKRALEAAARAGFRRGYQLAQEQAPPPASASFADASAAFGPLADRLLEAIRLGAAAGPRR